MAQCLQGVGDQRWRGSPPQTVPLPQGVLPVRGSMGNVRCRCTLKERFRRLDSSLIRNMDKVPTPPLFTLRLITCSDDVGKTDYRVAMRHARPGAPDHGDRGLIQRSPNDCVSGSPHIPGFCSLCRDKNGLNSCHRDRVRQRYKTINTCRLGCGEKAGRLEGKTVQAARGVTVTAMFG